MNYLSVLNQDLNLVNSINFNDKFIYLNRECNLKHWDSHFDHKNKIQLMILGRPVIEVLDWAKFDKSEENYITKFLIKKYIDLEINDFCNQLNGAFSILVIDYNLNKLLIITDKLGIYPIYTYRIDNLNSFQFSSNFKTLLDNINNKTNIDIASIAEFLKKGFIYHPNTFYKEIKTLDNGSYCILDFNEKKIIKKNYFKIRAKPIYNFDYLVNELSNGKSIAYTSDAGTPAISDPGAFLVNQALKLGIKVSPIPGPSSLATAFSVSGIESTHFQFYGFLPNAASKSKKLLQKIYSQTLPTIIFESPHRVLKTLSLVENIFGPMHEIFIARELTKIYETIYKDEVKSIIERLESHPKEQKGEFVIILTPPMKEIENNETIPINEALKLMMKELPLNQSVKLISSIFKKNKKQVYNQALEIKK